VPSSNARKSENSKQNSNDKPVMWAVLIAIVGVVILVIVGRFFVVEHSEKIRFVTVNTLSLFVFLAIVVQAYIYRRQWEVMDGQLTAARQALQIGTRAYVGIHSVEVDLKTTKRLFIKLENIGKVPAERITIRMLLSVAVFDPVAEDGKVREFAQAEETYDYGLASLNPGSFTGVIRVPLDLYFSDEELALIVEERASLSLHLEARYWDGFTPDQYSAFTLAYWGENRWSLQPVRNKKKSSEQEK